MILQYQKVIHQKLQEFTFFILERDFAISDDLDTKALFLKGWTIFIDHSVLEFAEKFSPRGHRYRFHYGSVGVKVLGSSLDI